MKSMTGFGSASGTIKGSAVSVEISSVNHRGLEISIRLPFLWGALENYIREKIRNSINRGKVNVWIRRHITETSEPFFTFNENVVKEYLNHIQHIKALIPTSEEISINTLVQLPGVFETTITDEELENIKLELDPLLDTAIKELTKSKEAEGKSIEVQIRGIFNEIKESVGKLEEQCPILVETQKEKLRAKLNELSIAPHITEERLAMEIVIWADRLDISEEISRIKTHLSRVDEVLEMKQNGKTLNFLVQELAREFNTISAKLRDANLAWEVVNMKTQLEKIREQIQNVE
ncbi:MAG: YicC family protein [Candidatus Hydrogenedentes bacterium]|nr:YicC family protein [Candidatus Hydrogenedentota bacterium]